MLKLSHSHLWPIEIVVCIALRRLVRGMMRYMVMRVVRPWMSMHRSHASPIRTMTVVTWISQSCAMMTMLSCCIFWIVDHRWLILNGLRLISFTIWPHSCLIIWHLLIIDNLFRMLDLLNGLRLLCWSRATSTNIDHSVWNFLNGERRLLLLLVTWNLSLVWCNTRVIAYTSSNLIRAWLL